jgi:hypothetical protein
MTQFHNAGPITYRNRIAILEDNIKSFLDWSFLNIGGFINVSIPAAGLSAPSGMQNLYRSSDPTISGNKLWESLRKDWIYESGVSYNSVSPINFSGIYLNNTFLPAPSGSGSYTYRVNYPLGQILFNNPVSSTSSVIAGYSYRHIQTYKSTDAIWWREVQKETYNSANYKPNGDYAITAIHRIQLPAIIIELAPRVELDPYQLGSSQNIWNQDLFLHIFTQNANQRNTLIDILLAQKDKVLYLYDIDKVIKSQRFPLNQYGSINPSGMNYPDLSSSFRSNWCTIKNSSLGELNTLSSSLFNGLIRWSIEIFP